MIGPNLLNALLYSREIEREVGAVAPWRRQPWTCLMKDEKQISHRTRSCEQTIPP
jgi:hypothetical protein